MQECLGCCTSFKEGEKLKHEEGLNIEFKNYNLPIQENKGKRTLLKTIVSFLNSQGGNIYITVQDTKGTVKGAELFEKDKQDFQEFVETLVQQIRPSVNVKDDSKVKVHFVPVISKKGFQNKYVPKIVVKQGDPSKTYYFMHQLIIQTENQFQNHHVLYSYIRHNMGGVEELKGLPLLKQIRNRAITPQLLFKQTHKCNPEPLIPEEAPGMVSLLNVPSGEHKLLELFFSENLSEFGVVFKASYRTERQTLFLNFQNSSQFEKTKKILKESLDFLSQEHPKLTFKIESDLKRELVITTKNKFESATVKSEEKDLKEDIKTETKQQQKIKKEQKKYQMREKQSPNKEKKEKKMQKPERKRENTPIQIKEERGKNYKKSTKQINFIKKHGITLTHINPYRCQQLIQFLDCLIPEIQMNFIRYVNTLEVFVGNNQEKQALQKSLFNRRKELKQFGFKQNCPSWGKNEKVIILKNYDKFKRLEMQAYLMTLMKGDILLLTFQNLGPKNYVAVIELSNAEKACLWLDKLITNLELKSKYGIPGSKENNAPKMKCILVVKNKYSQQLENANDYYL